MNNTKEKQEGVELWSVFQLQETYNKFLKRKDPVIKLNWGAFKSHYEMVFFQQGNFTICVLRNPETSSFFTGATKRNSIDAPNLTTGVTIAFWRALEHYYFNMNDAIIHDR